MQACDTRHTKRQTKGFESEPENIGHRNAPSLPHQGCPSLPYRAQLAFNVFLYDVLCGLKIRPYAFMAAAERNQSAIMKRLFFGDAGTHGIEKLSDTPDEHEFGDCQRAVVTDAYKKKGKK